MTTRNNFQSIEEKAVSSVAISTEDIRQSGWRGADASKWGIRVRMFVNRLAAFFAIGATCLTLQTGLPAQARHFEVPDDPAERVEFELQKRLLPGQRMPVEKYVAAAEHNLSMPHYSSRLGQFVESPPGGSQSESQPGLGTWDPLGPTNVGGRTLALVTDPVDPKVLYAGAASGGVWKTTDGGMTWKPTTDFLPNIAIGALAMDPSDRNTLYAGTGEGFYNIDAERGYGIYVTRDAGTTWSVLASTKANSKFDNVNRIVVSPYTGAIYAATNWGVFRSYNQGVNWTEILTIFPLRSGCVDLVLLGTNWWSPESLLASCGSLTQNPSTAAIYLNQSAFYSSVFSKVLSETDMGRTALAVAPSQANIVYAISSSNSYYGLHAFFKSTDGGATWTALVRDSDPYTVPKSQLLTYPELACYYHSSYTAGQGWYDLAIAVDPKDANRVWVGGIDLFRSDDGGTTWGIASYWYAANGITPVLHSDQHAIVFASNYNGVSNQTMYVASDGGIHKATNARGAVNTASNADCLSASGINYTDLNNGYATAQFYQGTPYPDGSQYFGGTQDNGTLRGTSGNYAWNSILNGDGGFTALNPFNTNIVFAARTGQNIYRSTDGGSTWSAFGTQELSSQFINPYSMDPSNPNRFWVGGGWMWRSEDAGQTFVQASTVLDLSYTGLVSATAVAPSSYGSVVAAGMSNGKICVNADALSANSSTVWPCTAPLPASFYVSGLAFDPYDAKVLYATSSTFGQAHIFRSTDQGGTWTSIVGSGNTGLPDVPTQTVFVDPDNTQRIYVGTDVGVYVSLDQGQHWAVENTGFANVAVDSLRIDSSTSGRSLYAFTHGRGAWSVPLGSGSVCSYTVTPPVIYLSQWGSSSPVNVNTDGFCPWQVTSNVSWIILDRRTGSGPGWFPVSAPPHNGGRIGTLTVAGQQVLVIQN